MKNFFLASSALYTFALATITFALHHWYVAPPLDAPQDPPTSSVEGLFYLAFFVLTVAALTSFVYGLWDLYVSKKQKNS